MAAASASWRGGGVSPAAWWHKTRTIIKIARGIAHRRRAAKMWRRQCEGKAGENIKGAKLAARQATYGEND